MIWVVLVIQSFSQLTVRMAYSNGVGCFGHQSFSQLTVHMAYSIGMGCFGHPVILSVVLL